MFLSIIIPSYNEKKNLEILLLKIFKVLKSFKFKSEIILVDDGSTDETRKLFLKNQKLKYLYQKNSGKGKAVQKGIKKAKGTYVLVQDADLEYDPEDYVKMLQIINRNNKNEKICIFGSRYIDHNKRLIFKLKKNQSFFSVLFNYLLVMLFIIFFHKKITDPLTGYKIYPRSFFKKNKINSIGFEADHEITIKLLKKGYKIKEVGIRYFPRNKKEGKKINFYDSLKALIVIIKYKFFYK
jgi:glycosyltransferase involved in cell wall biosynthesis